MSDGLHFKEFSATVPLAVHVGIAAKESGEELVLLLHGYGQTAKKFFDQAAPYVNDRLVCVLQAPFPVPVRGKPGQRIGYAWYAYDLASNSFYIPISTAVSFARQ